MGCPALACQKESPVHRSERSPEPKYRFDRRLVNGFAPLRPPPEAYPLVPELPLKLLGCRNLSAAATFETTNRPKHLLQQQRIEPPYLKLLSKLPLVERRGLANHLAEVER